MAVDRPITFRGLFTEDPDRKFGAESYFTANVCHENGARFQADCRDIYGFSYLQGNRTDRALIFTKIYTNRSDVLLYLLAPFKPGVEFWEWAGVWIRADEFNIDWLGLTVRSSRIPGRPKPKCRQSRTSSTGFPRSAGPHV